MVSAAAPAVAPEAAADATPAAPAPAAPRRSLMRAAAWLLGSQVGAQALRLISNLVLTRLLLPADFGLAAAVGTLYFGLVMFSDLGVWQSVVRSPRGHDPAFLGTAWAVQLGRGVLLAVLVLLIAAVLQIGHAHWTPGSVYADPRLPALMAVFALSALLQGGESMKIALAQRDLHGAGLARLELGSQLIALIFTWTLAWSTASVWALVLGQTVASAARTWGSHQMLPGPSVRPAWDRPAAAEVLGFGRWIFVSSIVGFLAAQGEKLLLAGSLAAASFGVFAIASTLLAALVGVLSSLNAHVVFAGLSRAGRDDRAAAARLYMKLQSWADLALGSVAGLLCGAGHWVVDLLYDARYAAAGWMLQILALGLLALRQQVAEQLMFARGQPAWVTANNALRIAALVVAVPLGLQLGGERGAVIGVMLSQYASWPLSYLFRQREGLLGWRSELAWLPALLAGLGLGWAVDQGLTAMFGH
ncbi:MAG: hypothetical protein RIQ60_2021 [Pseudomonadota bacterium]|jgi:O-antigen/teichoic acid export membrane protein